MRRNESAIGRSQIDGVTGLDIAQAGPEDAADLVAVMHAAFAARGPANPPPAALAETADTIAAALRDGGGVIARVDGAPAGAIVLAGADAGEVVLTRVSVHPRFQHQGIAAQTVLAAHDLAARAGFTRSRLLVRAEFPGLARWWQRLGYRRGVPDAQGEILVRDLPIALTVASARQMQLLGRQLAAVVRGGDVIIATGDLGSGKTTLTQGIAAGLGIQDEVISPTFVLSRVHRSPAGRPDLVHVDAYRLGSRAEVADIDLSATLAESVTVVEWGRGVAEQLASDRLELDLLIEADDRRTVLLEPVGGRWDRDAVRTALTAAVADV